MTKPTTGEQSTEPKLEGVSFADAINVVKAAIAAEVKRLEAITIKDDPEPVMLEGETSRGYQVQTMINPAKVAKVMLDYDYPTYKILKEDAPQGLWDELAKLVGLDSVYSVDL